MMHFATHDEALNTLVFIFEERGVFVTPADLGLLAARVVVELNDGGTAITLAPGELLDIAAEMFPVLSERAECPHTWCTGERASHSHLDPAEWEHLGEFDELAPHSALEGVLAQSGTEAPFYLLSPNTTAGDMPLDAAAVRALADDFERHAATLRKRALQLEALGSEQ